MTKRASLSDRPPRPRDLLFQSSAESVIPPAIAEQINPRLSPPEKTPEPPEQTESVHVEAPHLTEAIVVPPPPSQLLPLAEQEKRLLTVRFNITPEQDKWLDDMSKGKLSRSALLRHVLDTYREWLNQVHEETKTAE